MKFLVLFSAVIVCVSCMNTIDVTLNDEWAAFKAEHKKQYENDDVELLRRLTWEKNLRFIAKHNEEADAGLHTFWVGMNYYGDLV